MKINKVFVLTNVPVPYRVDFFNELGKNCELTVLFEQSVGEQTHRSAKWFDREYNNFLAEFLFANGEIRNPLKVIPHLKKNKNSIIIVMGYSHPTEMLAILWMRMHHIPFLLSCDGGLIKEKRDTKKYLKRFLISSAYACLSTGEATDRFLIYYGAKKERLYRIPFTTMYENEVLDAPLSDYERLDIRKELGMTEKKIIISVGQFIYRKGYDILLKASKDIDKSVGIYIIGSEPTEEYIQLRNQLGASNVHFVGFKNKCDLRQYYLAADLFVLPTREDIWGLVINEALACGLPIVTTNRCVAGLELVDDTNGCIIPVNDSKALSKAINHILCDEENYNAMRNSSLLKARNYTIENMAYVHLQLFSDIMKEKRYEYK